MIKVSNSFLNYHHTYLEIFLFMLYNLSGLFCCVLPVIMPPSALDRLGKMNFLIAFCSSRKVCLFLGQLSISRSYNLDVFMSFTASLHIDYPMLFELHNAATERVSHCGVLEFIAEEGMIYMPYWVSHDEYSLPDVF